MSTDFSDTKHQWNWQAKDQREEMAVWARPPRSSGWSCAIRLVTVRSTCTKNTPTRNRGCWSLGTDSETFEPDYWEFHVYILAAPDVTSHKEVFTPETGGTAFYPAQNLTKFLQTCLPPWNMYCIHWMIIFTSATSGNARAWTVLYTKISTTKGRC